MSATRSAGRNYGGRFAVEHWLFDSRSRQQVARRCNGKNASRSYCVLRACPGGGRGAGRAGGRSGGWSGSDQGKERGRRGSGADGDRCTESSRSGCQREGSQEVIRVYWLVFTRCGRKDSADSFNCGLGESRTRICGHAPQRRLHGGRSSCRPVRNKLGEISKEEPATVVTRRNVD